MDTDLDTLATALYVTVDDLLKTNPDQLPERPKVGIEPLISDAEMIVLAVMQALLSYRSESRWLRRAHKDFHTMFPTLPRQSGYNKRLRKLGCVMAWIITQLAQQTSVFTDDVWIVDSTPIECGHSRATVTTSNLAGWASYGYCASHSRWFWGLRLHLISTLHGLPIGWAVTSANLDERMILTDLTDSLPNLDTPHTLLADKGYRSHHLDTHLTNHNIDLIRPAVKNEPTRSGHEFLRPLRQTIESIFDTFKGQLDLENPGGYTPLGVLTRITQRILALTAAIWNNDRQGLHPLRSLIAYDH
ncbi:MAG: IS982 family transposase [Propionibacteriaceae bacterium]|jgi:hypothetical protein|nr:IS982 family transposase [Propionibacteriaceae bacterium]